MPSSRHNHTGQTVRSDLIHELNVYHRSKASPKLVGALKRANSVLTFLAARLNLQIFANFYKFKKARLKANLHLADKKALRLSEPARKSSIDVQWQTGFESKLVEVLVVYYYGSHILHSVTASNSNHFKRFPHRSEQN